MATINYLTNVPDSILNQNQTSNFGKLWRLFSGQLDEVMDQLTVAELRYLISVQTGFGLDQIGKLVKVDRTPGQSDASYRIDLYTGIVSFISSGSIPDIFDAIFTINPSGTAKLIEIQPATIQVWTTMSELASGTNAILNDVRAGGIGLIINYGTGTDVPFVFEGDSDGAGFYDIGASGVASGTHGQLVEGYY